MFVARYQAATSVPSVRRCTSGGSASLTNQSVPEATVAGADQVVPARSANLKTAVLPFCSIQLRSGPLDDRVSCGCPASEPAGISSAETESGVTTAAGAEPAPLSVAGCVP